VTASKEYDVLRLIEHKQYCYVSTDCVKGKSLVGWIKYHPSMKKEQMIQWIHDIIYQMIQIHKCRGNPCYQYVNPYSIVVSEEGKILFLDMNAASNQGKMNIMNRRNIRGQFLPEYEMYYQDANEQLDIYGLGKVIQYVLAFVKAKPELTRREERLLKKIINKCIQKNPQKMFTKAEELQKYLLELRAK